MHSSLFVQRISDKEKKSFVSLTPDLLFAQKFKLCNCIENTVGGHNTYSKAAYRICAYFKIFY
jgi:hypothetical protein